VRTPRASRHRGAVRDEQRLAAGQDAAQHALVGADARAQQLARRAVRGGGDQSARVAAVAHEDAGALHIGDAADVLDQALEHES
jgi:hypothetical protein